MTCSFLDRHDKFSKWTYVVGCLFRKQDMFFWWIKHDLLVNMTCLYDERDMSIWWTRVLFADTTVIVVFYFLLPFRTGQ